jgi:hypothetical protein
MRSIVGAADDARPFVCDGDPYACRAFVVGINPASTVPFWPFWNDDSGFDRTCWFECYKRLRACAPLRDGRTRRQAVSSTRQRIDWMREATTVEGEAGIPKIQILETNLYVKPTARAADLSHSDRSTEAFEFLLAELQPAVLLLHGKEMKERFEQAFSCSLSGSFSMISVKGQKMSIAAVPHLSRVSRTAAVEFGPQIRHLCDNAG